MTQNKKRVNGPCQKMEQVLSIYHEITNFQLYFHICRTCSIFWRRFLLCSEILWVLVDIFFECQRVFTLTFFKNVNELVVDTDFSYRNSGVTYFLQKYIFSTKHIFSDKNHISKIFSSVNDFSVIYWHICRK